MKENRIPNLDLFRAIAIGFVIFFHVTPIYASSKLNLNFYIWGKFGVEFFFVLSGFLVGGLYYKQRNNVNLFSFWFLRIFRTYPPYIIALILSYLAVFFARNENFDFGYLIFIQNYYQKIPYFMISWSLCIEEHFYVAFPVFIIILEKIIVKAKYQLCFWVLLSLLPTFLRWKFGSNLHQDFGYNETASFFRFDGIAMGCLLSYLVYRVKYKMQFSYFSKIAVFIFFLCSLLLNVFFQNSFFIYCFGYLFLNISLFFLIALFYFSSDFTIARFSIVQPIAAMAYSLYLTHALVINFIVICAVKFQLSPYFVYPSAIVVIFIAGFAFYQLIEKPTIRFRNYYFIRKDIDQPKFKKHLNHLENSTLDRLLNKK